MPKTYNTIFITVQLGSEIKNWFLGDFYRLAMENPKIRLVVFVAKEKLTSYSQQFGNERCVFEPLIDTESLATKFRMLFRRSAYAGVPSETLWWRADYYRKSGGSVVGFLGRRAIWYLGRTKLWRALLRFVEYRLFRNEGVWGAYFKKYQPRVVFAPTTYRDADVTMIKYAKRQGVPTVGMLRGWDNLSSKAFLFVHPDMLLVQNPTMVTEAMRWNDVPRKRIRIIGFPYLDPYYNPEWAMNRNEVAGVLGLDPAKRWILYLVGGLFTGILRMGHDMTHAKILHGMVDRGEFGNACIAASIHPSNLAKWDEKEIGPHFTILRFAKEWNFSRDNMKLLMNLIREADVAVDYGSSLTLETALFNVPTVYIGFNGKEALQRHEGLTTVYENTTHIKYVLDAGGVWVAKSADELSLAVNAYLKNPSLHEEGRRQIVKELVGPTDGKAGQRAFEALSAFV